MKTVKNPFQGRILPAVSGGGLYLEDHWVWCGSVVKGEDGRYHMFASAWPIELGFGAHWLFNCKILHAASDLPQGPYRVEGVALDRRGRQYFDGMNVHNPFVRRWNGKYYLYYMGTTYGGPVPGPGDAVSDQRFLEVWNKKRIGLAVSDSVYGPWKRRDTPLLEPRDCSHWDCTITTNPAVAILEDGTTYLLYKSRSSVENIMQLGVAKAPTPEGPFERLSEEPILRFEKKGWQIEDPYLWHQDGKFHLLFKNDFKENWDDISEDWGSGLYAVSEDCVHWDVAGDSRVYTRKVRWDDGRETVQANLERPFLLLDEQGAPTHLFLATGDGDRPYCFGHSWNMVMPIAAAGFLPGCSDAAGVVQ